MPSMPSFQRFSCDPDCKSFSFFFFSSSKASQALDASAKQVAPPSGGVCLEAQRSKRFEHLDQIPQPKRNCFHPFQTISFYFHISNKQQKRNKNHPCQRTQNHEISDLTSNGDPFRKPPPPLNRPVTCSTRANRWAAPSDRRSPRVSSGGFDGLTWSEDARFEQIYFE